IVTEPGWCEKRRIEPNPGRSAEQHPGCRGFRERERGERRQRHRSRRNVRDVGHAADEVILPSDPEYVPTARVQRDQRTAGLPAGEPWRGDGQRDYAGEMEEDRAQLGGELRWQVVG